MRAVGGSTKWNPVSEGGHSGNKMLIHGESFWDQNLEENLGSLLRKSGEERGVARPAGDVNQTSHRQRRVRACATCSITSDHGMELLRCSRCESVHYCGQECQRKHWPSHRAVCTAKIKEKAWP